MRKSPYLEHLKVRNFKSFKELDLELNQFNVIIGANASGKSNFIQIFNFIRDVRKRGVDNAISLQGGIEYLRNFKLGQEQNLVIELKIVLPDKARVRIPLKNMHVMYYTAATWEFELYLDKRSGFQIVRDAWNIDMVEYEQDGGKMADPKASGQIEITRKDGMMHYNMNMSQETILSRELGRYWRTEEIPSEKVILECSFVLNCLFAEISGFFDRLAVYDFDPKLAKKPAQPNGKLELNDDGSNLAVIVNNVVSNTEDRRKFYNLVTDLLPFVKSVDMENFAGKSILFTMAEEHVKKHSLPSSLISDGTISITALIIALYFQNNSLTVIEEVERNIHPSLISRVIEMLNDAASLRQTMITTHSPEIVRYAGLENLFTVRRDSGGHSEIIRPADQQEVKRFLENEMELKELYVQKMLEI